MKGKALKFDEVMDFYEEVFADKKAIRLKNVLKGDTTDVVAERIKDTIKLSEELLWKRPLKKQ